MMSDEVLKFLELTPWTPRSAAPKSTQVPISTQLESKVAQEDSWEALAEAVQSCQQCGLCQSRRQAVLGVGDRQARWLVIGEAPGEMEDRQGEPFVGPAGKLLDQMLNAVGKTRHQGVYIANVLKCRPPGNRNPTPEEVSLCTPYLHRQIALIQPQFLLLLGKFAAQTVLQSSASVTELRQSSHRVSIGDRTIEAVVSYHPAYLLRSPLEKAKAWSDLLRAQALDS